MEIVPTKDIDTVDLFNKTLDKLIQQIDPNYKSSTTGTTTGQNIRWKEPLAIGMGIGALDAATRKKESLPASVSRTY